MLPKSCLLLRYTCVHLHFLRSLQHASCNLHLLRFYLNSGYNLHSARSANVYVSLQDVFKWKPGEPIDNKEEIYTYNVKDGPTSDVAI